MKRFKVTKNQNLASNSINLQGPEQIYFVNANNVMNAKTVFNVAYRKNPFYYTFEEVKQN